MNATMSKKLRFSDAVYAIGTTPKSLRLWLQRGLVEIDTPKPENGRWTEYSFLDIAILALVRALVNFGVDVPTASALANGIMGDHFFDQTNKLKNVDHMPVGVLALPWTNRRVYLYRDGDDWQMKAVALWESELPTRAALARALPHKAVHEGDADFQPDSPSGISELRRELEPASVFISIDVETVLRTAFERANESANEGADDEDDA